MQEVFETTRTKTLPHAEVGFPRDNADEIFYPEQRKDDMGETSVHIKLIANLLQILKLYFKPREDVFLSGNMNLYYEEGNPKSWYAPDLLIAFGVSNRERSSYRVWKENVFPQVIFEIASNSTWKMDVSEKLELYSEEGAEEYYILDPEFVCLPAPLMAFHRQGERLLAAPVAGDKIFSPRLGLEIVRAENNFRLYNPQNNEFLLTLEESESKRQKAESEIEKLKAEIERLKTQK